VLLEASGRVGGKIRTDHEDGWQLDWGPQTLLLPAEGSLRRAIGRAGLNQALIRPAATGKARFVLQGGRLRRVPTSLPGLLGLGGFARLFGEVFVPRRAEGPAETVREFAIRRFGQAAADVLFDAFVTGIWAGDPGRLELRSAFPTLFKMETERGSLVRAAMGGAGARRKVYGFEGGLGRLPQAIAEGLGDVVRLETPALRLEQDGERWRVETPGETLEADAVLLTTPADVTGRLLEPLDSELAAQVATIPYAAAAVVSLGYRLQDMGGTPPQGFGFLIPHREGMLSLGCLFPSSVFPGIAPEGHALLRVIVGGRRRPEAVDLPEDVLVDRIRGEVEPILGIDAVPQLARVFRQGRAIPQYERGHAARLEVIEQRLTHHPGLFLAGNPYRGISVPDVAERAGQAAQAVAWYLSQPREGEVEVRVRPAQTCPLCRLPLSSSVSGILHVCAGCQTSYHRSCSRELGGCGTVGCSLFREGPSQGRG
jgi:oxygen-dependent protoporphyrinogen oxidase